MPEKAKGRTPPYKKWHIKVSWVDQLSKGFKVCLLKKVKWHIQGEAQWLKSHKNEELVAPTVIKYIANKKPSLRAFVQ